MLLAVGSAAVLAAQPGSPASLDKPLIAHWTFDDPVGQACRDASGHGHEARPARRGNRGVGRTDGVYGAALSLSGRHRVHVPARPDFSKTRRIGLSAWVRPKAFERYNEIFRKEDGSNRVLFSFQEHMRVLALGLNVGGYVECDASIRPKQVMDGRWHHCAATFDGEAMRVYLDGREIGSLERSGTIAAGGGAAGCIGSSNGGECFQGAIDDLRIYTEALTAREVSALADHGFEALLHRRKQLAEAVETAFAPRQTLAGSLAATRARLAEHHVALSRDLADALLRKLRARFPDECARLARAARGASLACLLTQDRGPALREAGRLVARAAEYKPLTDEQWQRLTPQQRARWQEVAAIERRLDALKEQRDARRFATDWMHIVLDASGHIQERPRQREAVAPYRPPSTPETRDLTPEQARATLERDWLHQADGRPAPQRIQQEIAWARQPADRIERKHRGEVDFTRDLA
ncbi:MAG: LamG domain-containing protein, partial [Planctomycetota bacterium]